MMKENIFKEVTEKIVESLKKGVGPWIRPWDRSSGDGIHRNAVTGRPYRGVNILVLNIASWEKGFGSPLWATYREAQRLGGHVRKGEKGNRVVFWKLVEEPELDPEGLPVLDEEREPILRKIVFGRSYTLFNVEQCEELNPGSKTDGRFPSISSTPGDRVAGAEKVLDLADIRYGGHKAAYNRSLDLVLLPERTAFKSLEDFYATGLHEMTHWSGHPSRLDREFGRRFGDMAYAFEELVAEMGAAFLGAHVGLPVERLQHPEYIGRWILVLEKDCTYKALFTGARKAQEASDFLLEASGLFERRREELKAA